MRPQLLLLTALAVAGAQASWFGSDTPEYKDWDAAQSRAWLQAHNVQVPEGYSPAQMQDLVKSNWNSAATWTNDQYQKAQQVFANVKDSTFEEWDESRLREFLLEQGVVAPSGPRESLALMAKQKYRAYTSAASSFSSAASTAASTAVYGDATHQASKSATSVYTKASASASSAYSVASNSASSAVAAATTEVGRKFDDSKDYVYSSWDESAMRAYLQEKGVVEPKAKTTREQLLMYMKDSYAKTSDPIYTAWSTSYIHEWLVSHDLIKSDEQKEREALLSKMQSYYYDTKDTAYSSWSESQLKDWLVERNIIKSDAQVQREKLQKMVADNYANAQDTVWGAWKDADMRDWLIEHGYLRSDAQKSRDELIKLMQTKYNDASAKSASYLVWPDARLRAYLRNNGYPEDALPTSRPGLLQEVRIRWVQTNTRVEAMLAKIKSQVNSGVEYTEEKLGQVLSILTGSAQEAGEYADEKWEEGKASAASGTRRAKATAYDAKATGVDSKEQNKGWLKGKASSASVMGSKQTQKVKGEL